MSEAHSTPRSSGYLDALSQAIHKKLQRALANSSQRRNLLQELFADIALEVDDRAKDVIVNKEEDAISPADDAIDGPLCFYDVLADYFVRVPESGKPILDLIVQLWSQSFASHIFTLLFHKWLFEVHLDNPEVLLRYSSALVQGATNAFWIDIQTNTRRFQSIFYYLLDDVTLDHSRLNKIPVQAQRDMYLLLSRFILFYNSADKIDSFLKHCPVFQTAFLVGGPADIFVNELTDQLQKLKVEPVLLHYLSEIKVLQGMELRMTTSTRLKTCLYSFTSPGGPMYPTRAVRHAAWEALDFLFSGGAIPSASYKSVLQVALSMVLAILLLELSDFLHSGNLLFLAGVGIFYVGKDCQAKNTINTHMSQRVFCTCIEPASSLGQPQLASTNA